MSVAMSGGTGQPRKAGRARCAAALAGLVSAIVALGPAPGTAQQEGDRARTAVTQKLPSVWDLPLGDHARELPTRDFIDYACGTNGGPPSTPVTGWLDHASCRAEEGTGYHEIYFEYDDEQEYRGRARGLDLQVMRYQYTWVNGVPVIASALFDDDGFLIGLRLVTDPRVETALREKGMILGSYMMARYGRDGWDCADLPRAEGESPFLDIFIKQHCTKTVEAEDGQILDLEMDIRNLRRVGQHGIGWDNVPTEGEFESTTRFQVTLAGPVLNREERLAAIAAEGPVPADQLVEKAMDCPGCDLGGANLKRANLSRANLAGADLTGANLHAAILTGANLSGAILSQANLNRADLRTANLEKATLQKTMLFGALLDGANLSGANMNGAMAGSIRMSRANAAGASIRAVDLRDARLNDVNFSGADLTSSWVDRAVLTRANFEGGWLVYVEGTTANFSGANLRGVDARGGNFFGSNFRGADFSGADFSYTRLTSANLYAATFDGTKMEETQLPAGFRLP